MKKRGFTLIELLAVIVVLAIVAIIAIPIIANVIENAKTGSFKASILNGSQAIDLKVLELKLTDIPANGINVQDLKLKNNFKSGKYKKDNTGKIIAINITNGEYCANGDVENPTITKGNCSDLLVLPEDRMMDSYIDDELYELMIQYQENLNEVSTEEVERVTNLLNEQVNQQKTYFFTNDLITTNESNEIVLPIVEKVTTLTTKEVPSNAIASKDISYKQDGKVMVWYLDEDNDTELEMYIGQDGGVIAPRNSIFLFSEFGKKYDLSNFNTSNVTNMMGMFYGCESLTSLDLSSFDTSNVTNMMGMFDGCSKLTSLDLSSFDTSKVTDMMGMFSNCLNLTSLDVSNFDTSKVTDMYAMFDGCSKLTSLDLSSFDTSKVTDMSWMFYNCSNLTNLDLSNFDTSKVTDMHLMFYNCESLTSLNLSNFDTSKVTDMHLMFYNCESLTSLDLSNFNTSNVTNMHDMFIKCTNLTTIYKGSKWVTAPTADDMFTGCGTSTLTLK